jgi:hypothetical protein
MPTITFASEKKEIQVPAGANLRKEALQAGVALYPGVTKVLNCHLFGCTKDDDVVLLAEQSDSEAIVMR